MVDKLKYVVDKLNGREYIDDLNKALLEVRDYAKENGIVIVTGQSDDLIEFDGAIYDEAGCWDGGTIWLDSQGNILDCDEEARNNNAKCIEALWCEESDYAWTYRTEIPHETFDVMEDGEHYCRGIVFYKSELAK